MSLSTGPARYYFPRDQADLADIEPAIVKYILPGYAPTEPFLSPVKEVVSAGSCFAENVVAALERAMVPATYLKYTEALNTPSATDVAIAKSLAGDKGFTEAREKIRDAQVFILTIGVALSPFLNGKPVFSVPDGVPHDWRMLSTEEVAGYTRSIISRVREITPGIPVVLTVSPLPLNSSFGHPSVFGQDCVSKSTLRVGIEAVLQQNIPGVYYWPSFEMTKWLSPHVGQFFGVGGADNRHVDPKILDLITDLFVDTYFKPTPD